MAGHSDGHDDIGIHILTVPTYLAVWVFLLVFLVITIAAAQVPLPGPANNLIAMGIALVKMMAVILFFMGVKFTTRLSWLFVGIGFFFLLIMFIFSLADYLTRHLNPGQPW